MKTKVDAKEFFSITNTGTVAGTWLGSHADISSYFDGMTIAFYQNNLAGANPTTININSLGAKTIYTSNDSKLTTHYGARALVMLQYDSDQDRFYAHDFYYSTSFTYGLRHSNNLDNGATQINGYQLLMEGIDGKMNPVTVGGENDASNTVQTAELRVGGLMLFYDHGTDVAAGGEIQRNELFSSSYETNMEHWNNRTSNWATARRPWYIVATMNSNGNFVLDNSSTTAFLTQDLPDSDDGKFYIMGGYMHDQWDAFHIQVDHPIYVYKNGAVRTYAGYSNASTDLYHSGTSKITATSGGVTVTGSVTETSDITLKDNVSTLENILESIKQIRGVNFTWKENGDKSIGVIAQEVETVFPDLVSEEEGVKGVNYSGLIGVLIEAVKELSDRVTTLESGSGD